MAGNPLNSNRPLRVVIVGAGASGLLMGYKLQRNFDDLDFQIYEKNPDVGGTWYENRYPGCACDNPSHTYVWSFDPNPTWSSTYASSTEIFEYFKRFQFRSNLGEKTKVSHQVVGAKWDDWTGKWNVEIKDVVKNAIVFDSCDVFVNAGGILNAWRWPAIPGLHDFKGRLVHSAAWENDIDLHGKHVGLIGNGSSGIQILPAILPQVSKCTTFIRGPSWVALSGLAGFEPRKFNQEEREEFANNPNHLLQFRRSLEHNVNRIFPLFLADSTVQQQSREAFKSSMQDALKDPVLEDQLIPKWAVGCRRLTPGVGYIEALKDKKTKVVCGEISRVSPNGCIMEDGNEYPVDVLVCATGFDTTFKPRFPLVGPHGRELADDWKDEPRSYMGVTVPGYPNYYMLLGPNSPIGNGPVLIGIEAQADYICKHIKKIQQQGVKSIEVTKYAVDDFIDFKDRFMKDTVWQQDCRSWYKGNTTDGKIVALWPGSTLHYVEALESIRWEDYRINCYGNRFDYFGNGLTKIETMPDADLAHYVRNEDDAPIIGSKFTYKKAAPEQISMDVFDKNPGHDAAVEAAEAAFKGPWGKLKASQRGEALEKLAAMLLEHKEELAYLDGTPTGKSVDDAVKEVEFGATILKYYAGWADKYSGESYPADDGFVKIVRNEPLGICAGINPWNGPIVIICFKLGPALAMGNVMILKPSEKTPLASNRIAYLASEKGILPPGVIQSLSGAGATGALLASHMRIRKVSFTGSVPTGKKIQEAAAKSNLKRVTLELGGKSPSAIFDDCNFDNAVWWSVFAITQNTGQACFAASRVYVQESIADKFIEAFTKGMSAKMNELNPLADKSQLTRVSNFITNDAGRTKILVGGKQHGDKGCYWEPTVFYNPAKDAQIYKEEIFGPVACISTFKDEEEFLRLANDSEFGLMSGVFTQDVNRAMRISAQLDSGVVGVNCVSFISLQAPFGGSKQSGLGRELSHYALRSYSEPKTVIINMTY